MDAQTAGGGQALRRLARGLPGALRARPLKGGTQGGWEDLRPPVDNVGNPNKPAPRGSAGPYHRVLQFSATSLIRGSALKIIPLFRQLLRLGLSFNNVCVVIMFSFLALARRPYSAPGSVRRTPRSRWADSHGRGGLSIRRFPRCAVLPRAGRPVPVRLGRDWF